MALRMTSAKGHLKTVEWLVSTFRLTADDARAVSSHALRLACEKGPSHLPVAQFLKDTFHLTFQDILPLGARTVEKNMLHRAIASVGVDCC